VFEVLSRGVRIWFRPVNPVFRSADLLIAPLTFFARDYRRSTQAQHNNSGMPGVGRQKENPGVKENLSVSRFIEAAMSCAAGMLDNASFIRKELVNVRMSKAHQAETESICSSLIGTKFDVVSEVRELDDLVASNAEHSAILGVSERIVHCFREDINSLHKLVMSLRAESDKNPDGVLASVLVSESAANILNAFNQTLAALEALRNEAGN